MSRTLVFIDSRVADYQSLIAGLGADAEWVLIDAYSDGIAQMLAALVGYSGLDSIQIVSHGSAGSVLLGTTVLDANSLGDYEAQLKAIGASLSEAGDLLLYGCNVAQGDAGAQFISSLARAAGADVAASTDLTGLGGNWVLEAASGSIEAAVLAPVGYGATLDVITGDSGDNTLSGTFNDDVISGLGGNDSVDGQSGNDSIDGGDGDDTMVGGFGNDTLVGDAGNDSLLDEQGSNSLSGGDGNDSLSAYSLTGQQTLIGGAGFDTLNAAGVVMMLDGGDGADELRARGVITTYAPSYTQSYVQLGSATLLGGLGSDSLYADSLALVFMQGGDGEDSLRVSESKSATLEGGEGRDSLSAVFLSYYNFQIGASFGVSYRLDGGADDDTVEAHGVSMGTLLDGPIDLALEGGGGNDSLRVFLDDPAQGTDYVIRQATLNGGEGNDTLSGETVLQLAMTGGSGSDTFALTAQQYQTLVQGARQIATQQGTYANNYDWGFVTVAARPTEVTDFVGGAGGDVLDVSDLLRNATVGYDGSNPFAPTARYLSLEQSGADTLVKFDADGAGSASQLVTIATLRNVDALSLTGFNLTPSSAPDGSATPGVVITGTGAADSLVGLDGADTIFGLDGADSIAAQSGRDIVDGGDGDDTLVGGLGNDTLLGGAGNDTLSDDQGSDSLSGGDGNDSLTAKSLTGQQTLIGGAGSDNLSAAGVSMLLDGGDDADNLTASGSIPRNYPAWFSSSFVQLGAATLIGGLGSDTMYADYLAQVSMQGGEGDDSLNVSSSKSATLEGGAGRDTLSAFFSAYTNINIGASLGVSYRLDGGADDDTLRAYGYGGTSWGPVDLALEGGSGNDSLSVSDDGATAQNAAEVIRQATLSGGEGNDTLSGSGVLQLTMTGGADVDTFALTAQQYQTLRQGARQIATQQPTQANGNSYGFITVAARPTEITDFAAGAGGDVLDVSDLLRNATVGYDGSNPFAPTARYLSLEQSGANTLVKFDADGAGSASQFVTIATLRNVDASSITAANFSPSSPLDGSATPGQLITGTDDSEALLGSAGADTISGLGGNDSVDGQAGNDSVDGGEGDDTLVGGYGNDTLMGGFGNDNLSDVLGSNSLSGGDGDDSLTAQSLTGQQTLIGGAGFDSLTAAGVLMLLDGGDDADQLYATGQITTYSPSYTSNYVQLGAATLLGGLGNDNLRADYLAQVCMQGGEDDDSLYVSNSKGSTLEGGAGRDRLEASFYVYANTDIGTSYGTSYRLDGGADDDTIQASGSAWTPGGSVDLELEGGSGNDSLSAVDYGASQSRDYGIRQATLSGGDGNDTLSGSGVLQLTMTGGADIDIFALTAQQYQTLVQGSRQIATRQGTPANNYDQGWITVAARPTEVTDFVGGVAGDVLDVSDLLRNATVGYDGSNPFAPTARYLSLEQSGANTLVKFDADGAGSASQFVTIATLRNVAASSLRSANFNPNFATLNNEVTGTDAPDLLYGQWGNDTIDGLADADTMIGGAGDDTYVVDEVGDLVIEQPDEGNDQVTSSVNYTLGSTLENLTLAGVSQLSGTGNDGANVIRGNSAANALTGMAGDDTLEGVGGDDTLLGGYGSDRLVAELGGNQLWGDIGADAFVLSRIQNADNTIDDFAPGDRIELGDLAAIVSVAQGDGTAMGLGSVQYGYTPTRTTLFVGLDSTPGADAVIYLDGAINTSVLRAIGNTLVINAAPTGGVTITGTATQGQTLTVSNTLADVDGIPASGDGAISYQWQADGIAIDGAVGSTLLLTQSQVGKLISVTARYTDNSGQADGITSAATTAVVNVNDAPTGSVTISGEAVLGQTLTAADTLADLDGIPASGAGAISYQWEADGLNITGAVGSTLVLAQAQAGKAISVTARYTDSLGAAESQTSTATAPVAIYLVGTDAPDNLTGLAGADTLDGGASADTMTGGLGNDVYFVDSTDDRAVETSTDPLEIDSVYASATWTMPDNVENLTLTGTGAITGTGNILANVITGNAGNNTLIGGAGDDTLVGGDGNDTAQYAGAFASYMFDGVKLSGPEGTDMLLGIETLVFSDATVRPVRNPNSVDTRVNTSNNGALARPAVTLLSDGGWVVSWQDGGLSGQRYDAQGVAVGGEFQIASSVTGEFYGHAVAALAGGAWVVTWAGAAGDGIFGQRHNADGSANGAVFQATSAGAGSSPTIAVLPGGGWVVAWSSSDGDAGGVYSRVYRADGTALAAEFRANTVTTGNQGTPSVAAVRDGWVVFWAGQDESLGGIFGQRFQADGTALGGEFRANTDTVGNQGTPVAAALGDGGWVVVWNSDGSLACGQRYNADGTANGAQFQVNSTPSGYDTFPAVTALADGGWVVTWTTLGQTFDVYARRYGSDGVAGAQYSISAQDSVDEVFGTVAATADGGWVMAWGSGYITVSGPSDWDVYTQRYAADGQPYRSVLGLDITGNATSQRLVGSAGDDTLDGAGGADTLVGGRGNDTYVVDSALDVVVEVAGEGTDTVISSVSYTLAANVENLTLSGNAAIDATGNSLANVLIGNGAANLFIGGLGNDTVYGGGGNDTARYTGTMSQYTLSDAIYGQVRVAGPDGTDDLQSVELLRFADATVKVNWNSLRPSVGDSGVFQVNPRNSPVTYTEQASASTGLPDGGWLVTWDTYDTATDNAYGIGLFGHRYDAYGVSVGDDFLIDPYPQSFEDVQSASCALTDGGWVVTWDVNYNDGVSQYTNVYGQRYDAEGAALGTKFEVSNASGAYPYAGRPAIAGLSDGGWVVVWRASGELGLADGGVYAQRYGANGAPISGPSQVGSLVSNDYYNIWQNGTATVTALADGGWMVCWDDGLNQTAYGQRYNAQGTADGSVIQFGAVAADSVGVLADGGWVLAAVFGQDIYGQQFAADGVAVGDYFQIIAPSSPYGPNECAVTTLDSGGWLVTWGDSNGFHGQRFSAVGSPVGDQFASVMTDSWGAPSVKELADGGWVVTCEVEAGDDSGIYSQRYDANGVAIQPGFSLETTGDLSSQRLTASSMADVLIGLGGDDTLEGGAGADTLNGGAGNDTYVVDSVGDVVVETNADAVTGGIDQVNSSVSYTLAANVEDLLLVGTANLSGTGNGLANVITGNSGSNSLSGLEGKDTLIGGLGDDTLEGGAGDDSLIGGEGTDTARYSAAVAGVAVDLVLGTAVGADIGTDSLSGIENITGGQGADVLLGNAQANVLDGGTGADTLTGGDGSDVYFVDNLDDVVTETNIDAVTGGTDQVNTTLAAYTLGANIERGRILSAGAANLTGNSLANVLYAGAGNNVIDGSTGTDTADYSFASAGVNVSLAITTAQVTGGSGTDTLRGIENLTGSDFNDTLSGNSSSNVFVGGLGADSLVGNSGSDTLDGGAGADTLIGGDGSDTYLVDNVGDTVTETNATAASGGTDLVKSTVSFTLGANLEKLTLLGTDAIDGTGNELANTVTGNAGANVLDGGTGADKLIGGDGSDTYIVDNAGDTVTETNATAATGGVDLVRSSVNFTLGRNIEQLTLTGAGALNGTGNTLANIITGNASANVLSGGSGADTLTGGDGSDTYIVDNAGDIVTETNATALTGGIDQVNSSVTHTLSANVENLTLTGTSGLSGTGNTLANVITGNTGANVLSGGDGADTLTGGLGADRLTGGTGADTFRFVTTGDGSDTITDFASGTDKIYIVAANFGLTAGAGANLVINGTPSSAAAAFVYNSTTGVLGFDSDGNGAGAATQLATLSNKPVVFNSTDFVLGA